MLDMVSGSPAGQGLELRPYQREAIDGIYSYFREKKRGNPLVVVPTGGGKSLIIATFIREALELYPDTRILILTHVRELIQQSYAELIGVWPDAPAGIYSAGLGKRDLHSRVLFAGIQSIHKRAYDLQDPPIDLVLVDEAHLIPRSSNTTYRKFLNDLEKINPSVKVIGFTATPFRLDSGLLHRGEDAVFDDIAYDANLLDLIEAGYLTRPVSKSAARQIDTAGVATRGGEFVPGQLEAAAMHPEVVAAVADEIVAHSEGRRGILAFGCGVDHCRMLRDALVERGISCESIFGDTPKTERDSIVARFKRQEIWALSSMGVLTTGFNAKHVDLLAVARPTKSTGLWIQMVGRGTRLFPDKENCLVLDFGGNTARHGPIDQPRVKAEKAVGAGPSEAPSRECPNCGHRNWISARVCEKCASAFPDQVQTIDTSASTLGMLSVDQALPQWVEVDAVTYRRHPPKVPGKPPTMRVIYQCGMVQHSEWVCFEHTGYPRQKAAMWWQKRAPGTVVPFTIDEALERVESLPKPRQIAVKPKDKHTEVVGAIL